jgi:hypothetical protein
LATASPPCSAANPISVWPARGLGGSEVGDRGRHQQDLACRELLADGGLELGRRLDVDPARAGGLPQGDVRGDQDDLRAAPRRSLGEGEAHPPARAVANETDGVDRLTGPARGYEHP